MTRDQISFRLCGVLPPVITPFNRRGDIDYGRFRENLSLLLETGVGGIVVAGSTGEAPFLNEQERLRLIAEARRLVRPPKLLIAGTGFESTELTIRHSRDAISRGADAVLVITPGYYKSRMDGKALITHYRAVADGVRQPVIIYNIPQFTGVRMAPETIATLARHPNIVGLKESSGDLAYDRAILRAVKPGFRVLIGSPVNFLEALQAGAAGGVLGQADIVPELCVGVYEAFRNRQSKLARDLQRRLTFLAENIGAPFGVAGIKAAAELRGFHGGPPRAPLMPINKSARRRIAAALQEALNGLDV